MNTEKRRYFRPLRKTYRPWKPPVHESLKMTKKVSPTPAKKRPHDAEWTAEEWDRIWRSASE